jgi:hypothetical protein
LRPFWMSLCSAMICSSLRRVNHTSKSRLLPTQFCAAFMVECTAERRERTEQSERSVRQHSAW